MKISISTTNDNINNFILLYLLSIKNKSSKRYKSRINDVIEIGEKSRQTEDNYGKLKIKYKENNVTEFILDWLERNKVRTPLKILDLINELDEYVDIQNNKKNNKSFDLEFKRRISINKKYDEYLNDRTRVFSGLIRKHEELLADDFYPPEFDILIKSDIIYANSLVISEIKKANRAIISMKKIKRTHNAHTRYEIHNKIKFVILATINIMLRVLEIEFKFEQSEPIDQILELLEWDLNTLQIYNNNLQEYSASIVKNISKAHWDKGFTDETRELIRLFSNFGDEEDYNA